MTELQISIFDKNGELKCQASDQDQAIMVFEGTYEEAILWFLRPATQEPSM